MIPKEPLRFAAWNMIPMTHVQFFEKAPIVPSSLIAGPNHVFLHVLIRHPTGQLKIVAWKDAFFYLYFRFHGMCCGVGHSNIFVHFQLSFGVGKIWEGETLDNLQVVYT